MRNATQRTPEMAKIVRTEGGAHQTRPARGRPARTNPCGVTSRWPPMQLGRLRQTIRSDRDPSPAAMAHACTDRPEIDLLLESRA